VTGNEYDYCDNNPINFKDSTGFITIVAEDENGNNIVQFPGETFTIRQLENFMGM